MLFLSSHYIQHGRMVRKNKVAYKEPNHFDSWYKGQEMIPELHGYEAGLPTTQLQYTSQQCV